MDVPDLEARAVYILSISLLCNAKDSLPRCTTLRTKRLFHC